MDMELMDVISAFVAITMPIVATILLSGHQTQRILREIKSVQQDMQECLLKLDFGFRANALMHGWRREDGVTPERARRLPEPKVYDEKLGVCYFKPD
jgi:hypothetical protein